MNAGQQGAGDESMRAMIYRYAQCYDYESSLASFTGSHVFSLFCFVVFVFAYSLERGGKEGRKGKQ
jgi:hypothetical protein